MYSEISLDTLFALVKEAYETFPKTEVRISLKTRSVGYDPWGGSIYFFHSKELPTNKTIKLYSTGNLEPNPNLDVYWRGKEFQAICRKYGIEPEEA